MNTWNSIFLISILLIIVIISSILNNNESFEGEMQEEESKQYEIINKLREDLKKSEEALLAEDSNSTEDKAAFEAKKKTMEDKIREINEEMRRLLTGGQWRVYNPDNSARSSRWGAWRHDYNHNRGQLNSPQAWSAPSRARHHHYEIRLPNKNTPISGFWMQGRKDYYQYIRQVRVWYYNNNHWHFLGYFNSRWNRSWGQRNWWHYTSFGKIIYADKLHFRPEHWHSYPSMRIGLRIKQ